MSDRHHLLPYPHGQPHGQPAPFAPTTTAVLQGAAVGATLGAAAATAAQLSAASADGRLALGEIVQASVVSGLTTAAATLAGQSLGRSTTLTRYAAMFVTSAALMYLLNPSKQGESS
ncbi:MAG: hypothetical protein EKK71_06395 [Candidatus Competibacteraceae bacterium]|nr:MAG: hypothetical protein EKK71_06395 [Candidatus Competibacteraceae bacterium]